MNEHTMVSTTLPVQGQHAAKKIIKANPKEVLEKKEVPQAFRNAWGIPCAERERERKSRQSDHHRLNIMMPLHIYIY